MTGMPSVTISDDGLEPADVRAVARDGAAVRIAAGARRRMAVADAAVRRAAAGGEAVYGLTTGLGSRAVEAVDAVDGAAFSVRTVRGRATAVGAPLSVEHTRAAMVVRLAGLCAGGSGASPAVADALAAALDARVHPRVPGSGSVGASDLCLMAHVGLGLIGEGDAELDGAVVAAGEALRLRGLAPLGLGPRDGLAICSSSAVSVGVAALASADARNCLAAAQVAAALSMEGFRANVGPLRPGVVAARPAPGQAWASADLLEILGGGGLLAPGAARRVQDPLSFRCVGQLHGSLETALGWLDDALRPELSGAADNPLVLANGDVVSTGNFQTSALALALDAAAIAVAQVGHGIAERVTRLGEPRTSGLPAGLVAAGLDVPTTRSGVAPLSKTAHALVLELRHAAAPLAIHSVVLADGVEDDGTGALQGALRLDGQLARLRRLVALELLVAAQAVDVAGVDRLGHGTGVAHRCVRELLPPLGEDRPLGPEVELLAETLVSDGALVRRVAASRDRPAADVPGRAA